MKIFRKKIITVFVFNLFLLNGCSKIETGNPNVNQTAQANQASNGNLSAAKDDLEELGKIINLPVMPEEAMWRDEAKKITAVIRFAPADAENIAGQAAAYKPAGVAADIDAESWFPAELIAQSQLSGDETLKGTAFAANDFLREPYNQGKITRIDNTNYFVLELTAP